MAKANRIDIPAELELYQIDFEHKGSGTVRVVCPFHDDNAPSLDIVVQNGPKHGVFQCRAAGCGAKGHFVDYLARVKGTTQGDVLKELQQRYNLSTEKAIPGERISKYHNLFMEEEGRYLREELYKRGLNDDTITDNFLGLHKGRITIPVKNDAGSFVLIRSYLPGAPGDKKMFNLAGRTKIPRIYPVNQLGYERIIITGGEVKALALAQRLNKHGIGAVCVVGGEGTWKRELNAYFYGKQVWVIMDIDEGGVKAAERVCSFLHQDNSRVHNVLLPLDAAKHPKGDVNDYVTEDGYSDEIFIKLLEEADLYKPPSKIQKVERQNPEKPITLSRVFHAQNIDNRVKTSAVVSGVCTSPYAIASKVQVTCDRDQPCCAVCNIFPFKPEEVYEIDVEDETTLEFVEPGSKGSTKFAMKDALHIPQDCRVCKFNEVERVNIERVMLSSRLDITENAVDKSNQPALIVGEDVELNGEYEILGTPQANPRSRFIELIVSQYKEATNALTAFELEQDISVLQPDDDSLEALNYRIEDICRDMEANVTGIIGRPEIQIAFDLVWHSPLVLPSGERGWINGLIVGDTAQGKSETVHKMLDWLKLGERVVCKNATRAGLLGGTMTSGNNSFVTWGPIPRNDRRAVVLEELKGLSTDYIATLTDMRDSGIAELRQIQNKRTKARTRILALSNPRHEMSMDQFTYGCSAVSTLIGSPEDVRRFDFAIGVASSDVPEDIAMQTRQYPHVYTSDICRNAVLWAWTRRREQIIYEDGALTLIENQSKDLLKKYDAKIPIVDPGSMKGKLTRMAAAVAARVFSTDETCEQLIIKKVHILWVVGWLHSEYDKPSFEYDAFSSSIKRQRQQEQNLDEPTKKILKSLIERQHSAQQFVKWIQTQDQFTKEQFGTAFGPGDSADLFSQLILSRAIQRQSNSNRYAKTPAFNRWIQDVSFEEPPEHIIDDTGEF